ncbi:MAG: excinuclease ABC subunit UvrC [Coriobacteriales bacterium]|jgi:excinuclease ABC subunit C|nr:excinuclease ABC subunit UvrC [Coriobacteriales bacterium]
MDNMHDDAIPTLKEQLASVPKAPGVYLWKDTAGNVLYVGKAKDLRARMRQYLSLQDERPMIPMLVAQSASFDYLVTNNEHESLILEKNLIDQFSPAYNVDFKDDKSYPYIALTMSDSFPALKYTRERHLPGIRYFGPYTDARAARMLIEVARRITPICLATCDGHKRLCRRLANNPTATGDKPCFNYSVGLGLGPCTAACTVEEYATNVEKVVRFLSGQRRAFIVELKDEMALAVDELDFEKASRLRDRIETIQSLDDRQNVQLDDDYTADVIGFYREETITGVQVLAVREGSVLWANEFVLDKGRDIGDAELVKGFMMRYYESASSIPPRILLASLPEDSGLIADWLTVLLASAHGQKVRLLLPVLGDKRELLDLAERNAHHALNRYKVRSRYDEERANRAMLELQSALALPTAPLRIECFDISTIHGQHSVGSMVVFTAGSPEKSEYRRFRIRMAATEANDVAMMKEVLSRRFAPKRLADTRFGIQPDLIIVDGGRPQLNTATTLLAELGLEIPVAGLAKAEELLFTEWSGSQPIVLPTGSAGLHLVKQLRDEAHRFAINYHRGLRGKTMKKSLLDDIEGLGPKRRKALLSAFGSVKRIQQASVEQIAAVKGIPAKLAQQIYDFLHQP